MANVVAVWSGGYPTLCFGTWSLEIDGFDVSDRIPKDKIESSMRTHGEYQSWYFNDGGMEEFYTYIDGLDCEDWIEENKYWLDIINVDEEIQRLIYEAISEEDFRSGSCGGCI